MDETEQPGFVESVQFKNFRALKDTTLPIGRLTLIVGPNGSGKSTALEGIALLGRHWEPERLQITPKIELTAEWVDARKEFKTKVFVNRQSWHRVWPRSDGQTLRDGILPAHFKHLEAIRKYNFISRNLRSITTLQPNLELQEDGSYLAGVLDRLRDEAPERFESLNRDLSTWLPEFDRVLFETPGQGQRLVMLRQQQGGTRIPASQLSDGTLFALAILTLANLKEPPTVLCLEEPDQGIHPRLLRDIRDALYRLAYPEDFGESREPVQVVATTHSPYFLNLFKDHPEEIVIAEKLDNEAKFVRLVDLPNIDEILRDSDLGDVWYTGILAGVPSR